MTQGISGVYSAAATPIEQMAAHALICLPTPSWVAG